MDVLDPQQSCKTRSFQLLGPFPPIILNEARVSHRIFEPLETRQTRETPQTQRVRRVTFPAEEKAEDQQDQSQPPGRPPVPSSKFQFQRILPKNDRKLMISSLFLKYNARHGAGLETAQAILAELKLKNHRWGIRDLEDVQKGIEHGFYRLGYLQQGAWYFHQKTLKKFENEEVLPYLASLNSNDEPGPNQ